jgi:hypothetical protein
MDAGILNRIDDGFVEFQKFVAANLNPSLVKDEETGRFVQVALSLCQATEENFTMLRRAYEAHNDAVMAWGCRNLLEVLVFTRYALKCKKNAEEFAADRLIDAFDIATTLKKLELHFDPKSSATELNASIDECSKQMQQENVARRKFLSVKDLAQQVNMLSEYELMNKVCSKFVHPTAWSIFTSDSRPARMPMARDLFLLYGAEYFTGVFAEIAPHVRKYGLRHKA